MRKTQSKPSFRGRQLVYSSHIQPALKPLTCLGAGFQFQSPRQFNNKHTQSLSSAKFPVLASDKSKNDMALQLGRAISQDSSQENASFDASPGRSQDPPMLHILALCPAVSSPKTQYEIAKEFSRKNAYNRSLVANERSPILPHSSQKHQTPLDSPNMSRTNFQLSVVENMSGTSRLQTMESMWSQLYLSKKAHIRRRLNKQRATLKNLTGSETKLQTHQALNLYVEPAAVMYTYAGDIIEDLLEHAPGTLESIKEKEPSVTKKAHLSSKSELFSPNKRRPLAKVINNKVENKSGASFDNIKTETVMTSKNGEKEKEGGSNLIKSDYLHSRSQRERRVIKPKTFAGLGSIFEAKE